MTADGQLPTAIYGRPSAVCGQFQPILNFLRPNCDYLYMNEKSFVDDDDNRPLADGLAETLPLYAANQLAPEQRAQVDAWLAADPAAQAELALWRQLQRGLLHRPAVSAPPDLARMILAQELPAYASTKGRSVGRQPAPSGWRRWGWRVALQGTFSLIALLLLWVVVQPGLALEWTVAGGQPEAFRVYRAPLDGGAPTLLREIPAQADAAAYRYVDYKALPGQAYRYQVEAVNGHLVQSEWMVGRGWELLPYQLALLLVSLAAGYSLAAFIQIAAAHWRLRQGLTMSL
jgi:hypothetical protein